jgi:23S rRNA pseudouridine955/2504/2580 synthase
LLSEVLRYLQNSGEYDPLAETTFAPALCNRIDRNTSGIVIAAKNAEALRIINEKIRLREIDKYYLAAVSGRPNPPEGKIEGFWTKDKQKNLATISLNAPSCNPIPADIKKVITEYKTLKTTENISLVECKLITGRSHQIRAHLSAIGHPIIGDKKYGGAKRHKITTNAEFEAFQALCSYKLIFSFKSDAGTLSYLDGKTFMIENIPFFDEYFGGGNFG